MTGKRGGRGGRGGEEEEEEDEKGRGERKLRIKNEESVLIYCISIDIFFILVFYSFHL